MKKIIIGLILTPLFFTDAFAHKLILSVYGNDDDTITITGEFDTGASAFGALVRLETLGSGDVLFQKRLPEESELTVKIPEEPYQIVLDGGPGHVSIKKGIPPEKGFTTKPKPRQKSRLSKAGNINLAWITSLIVAGCLLLLTIFISIRNTDKILSAISNNSSR